MKCLRNARERGTILVLAAAGAVVLLGATAMSVDVGYFFFVRNQLQNAVDAAALAGAQGLLAQPGDYTSSGRAQQLATEFAALNIAAGQPVQLQSSEITFPKSNVIKIDITRPAGTFFAAALGMNQVNIRVSAAAAIAPFKGGGGPGGWRPWAPMDQFGHGPRCVGANDEDMNVPPHGDFNPNPHTWKGLAVQSDKYVSPFDPSLEGMDLSKESDCSTVTGYITSRDVMTDNGNISLKTGSWESPGNFVPVDFGAAGGGANDYQDEIINGWDGVLEYGDVVYTETGNMVGPTSQGCNQLLGTDPSAKTVKGKSGWYVESSAYGVNESPRLIPVVMYSPLESPANGKKQFPVRNFGGFFVQSCGGGKTVRGTFIARRMAGGKPGDVHETTGNTSGAGGQLLGTVVLVNPDSY
ncbi:MAG: hypothetical protein HY650_01440 [Acidobacteria bacterium]|nr:hypothetical protein [Acidobacteriota bacterium]